MAREYTEAYMIGIVLVVALVGVSIVLMQGSMSDLAGQAFQIKASTIEQKSVATSAPVNMDDLSRDEQSLIDILEWAGIDVSPESDGFWDLWDCFQQESEELSQFTGLGKKEIKQKYMAAKEQCEAA